MVMATRTAQSGLWSDPTTWGGTVPVNGDAFNIPVGVVVKCDVDQSSMATGMAASVIDGLLHFDADTNTCLKMNGNITGTGALYICERATVTGWTLTTGKTNTYQVARSLDVATVEDTLGAGYLDAVEELVEVAIDTENAARVAQGLNEMMPDAVQTFIESTRASLTLSQILTYVEATQGSFYHDTVNDVLYIHTSDSTDPTGKTITVIEPINRPAVGSGYRSYILLNSTGTIGVGIVEAHGWCRIREWSQLSSDAALNDTILPPLLHDMELAAGDTVIIGSGSEAANTAETAKGIYTVQSYDAETKIITLTVGLQTARLEGDYVAIWDRPILIARTSGTAYIIGTNIPKITFVGVNFSTSHAVGETTNLSQTINGGVYKHCTAAKHLVLSTNYSRATECVSNYDITSACVNACEDRCIVIHSPLNTSRNITGVLNNFIYQNIKNYGGNQNNKRWIEKNGIIKNMGSFANRTILKNCSLNSKQVNTFKTFVNGGYFGIEHIFIDCQFNGTEVSYLEYGAIKAFNCLFEDLSGFVNYLAAPIQANIPSLESFDHNQQPGNYKAWMKGGKIETDTEDTTILPGRLILTCESADYPVFRDFPVLLPAYRTSTWQALTRKSFTGGSVKMELIDPAADPLIDPTAAPLATYTLPDQADTNLPLKLGYKSDKAMLAILRVSAQNSTGTVEIDTRLIENRVQHGQ